jgi:putative transcriptional regulator
MGAVSCGHVHLGCVGMLRIQATMKNRLKELRLARNWSQGALADELDVSRQTVNALETGRFDPSLPLAFKISRLFELSIESIFLDEP